MAGLVDATGRAHVIMDGDIKRLEYATECADPGDVIR